MKEVDGFTLIDYIKSSVEILMNMKIEENDGTSIGKNKQKKNIKDSKLNQRFEEAGNENV